MLIANRQINYKNAITPKGKPFKCEDEEVIERFKGNGTITDTSKKKTVVKKKSTKVIEESSEDN